MDPDFHTDPAQLSPKKSLGQNFLTSEGALDAIAEASGAQAGKVMLEIGPGKGALTHKLIERGAAVVAVEKDDRLIPYLEEKFAKEILGKSLRLIHADALELDISSVPELARGFALAANIPYYITGAFLRKYLSAVPKPASMTILVQKEVAERIVARNGKESILSISVKVYGIPSYVMTVKAGSFFPAPNVDSAVIHIGSISDAAFKNFPESLFFELVRAGFSQKRKMLKNNIAALCADSEQALEISGIPVNARAEDLTLAEWKTLAEAVQKNSTK